MEAEKALVEKVDEFKAFLCGGDVPSGITLRKRPRKMTPEQAMAVIYLLQEFVGVLPDTFEMCTNCSAMFDTDEEGHIPDDTGRYAGKFFCSGCSYLCKCVSCKESSRWP